LGDCSVFHDYIIGQYIRSCNTYLCKIYKLNNACYTIHKMIYYVHERYATHHRTRHGSRNAKSLC
jgi:hypothetical protein